MEPPVFEMSPAPRAGVAARLLRLRAPHAAAVEPDAAVGTGAALAPIGGLPRTGVVGRPCAARNLGGHAHGEGADCMCALAHARARGCCTACSARGCLRRAWLQPPKGASRQPPVGVELLADPVKLASVLHFVMNGF